jgi:hypothetical protein
MANGVYNKGKYTIFNAGYLNSTGTLKVLLVTSSYSFDADHNFVSDVSANEISVSGYSRQALGTPTRTEDDTNDFAYLDGDDTTFASLASGQTVGGAIVFWDMGGADSANPLLAFYDLTNTATNGGDIVVQWAAAASGAVLKGA